VDFHIPILNVVCDGGSPIDSMRHRTRHSKEGDLNTWPNQRPASCFAQWEFKSELCMDGSINLQCGRKNDNALLQIVAKLGFMNWEVG
jgi:hypothetical protein